MLRRYALGRASVDEVYDVVLGTVDLIFSPAPRRTRRATTVGE
jgi:hypothetical protein